MINHFRTILLNMLPANANANRTVAGYMYTDVDYINKPLSSENTRVYNALFVDCVTNDDFILRATTLHKIVESSMLSSLLTKYDTRITGVYASADTSVDTIPAVLGALKGLVLSATDLLFTSITDGQIYAEHFFHRKEPIENITGITVALVENIITKRLELQHA